MASKTPQVERWMITWHRRRSRWQCFVRWRHRQVYVGMFESLVEARLARNQKIRELFGPGGLEMLWRARRGVRRQETEPESSEPMEIGMEAPVDVSGVLKILEKGAPTDGALKGVSDGDEGRSGLGASDSGGGVSGPRSPRREVGEATEV